MLNHIDKEIITRIDKLINKGENVLALYPSVVGVSAYNDRNVLRGGLSRCEPKQQQSISNAHTLNESSFTEWQSQVLSFLINLLGTEGTYTKKFEELVTGGCRICVDRGLGVLRALKEDISQGYLTPFKSLVAADMFSDFLEMAEYLLEESYKDAAAVITGGVLEEHLRKLCDKNAISVTTIKEGKPVPLKAETLNQELNKANVCNKLDMKQVTSWLDLRNKAAHGKYDEYTKEQVILMLKGVMDFVRRNK
jgi:hypothetical protein